MLHYAPQHVLSSTLLILRRTDCITTTSGIVTLCKQPYSMQTAVRSPPAYCTAASRGWQYQRLWWYNLSSWGWAACCSKHVEDRSVTYILLKSKRIVHQVGNLKKSIVWCTVRKNMNPSRFLIPLGRRHFQSKCRIPNKNAYRAHIGLKLNCLQTQIIWLF